MQHLPRKLGQVVKFELLAESLVWYPGKIIEGIRQSSVLVTILQYQCLIPAWKKHFRAVKLNSGGWLQW